MDTEIYKVIPWEEVAIGQDFEKSKQNWDLSFFANPWIKRSLVTYQDKAEESAMRTYGQSVEFECIVRIADCKPEFNAGESSVENVLTSILTAMKDIQNSADDTLWINKSETVFERLWEIYIIHGGDIETLRESFPLCA